VGNYQGKEIDFITQKDHSLQYFQVARTLNEKTSNETKTQTREFDNLLQINDNYPKYVISLDTVFGKSYHGVQWLNALDFLTNFN
jgi:predicted AAA+ superfamily ATPase